MSENSDTGHLFLSYSRRQFYFAESVVLSLQEAGEQVWFDVQELAPGEHWRDEIQQGLDEARGIIVIVSRASMASKYVRQEWEPMIAAGKPIYLVIFEEAVVPPELEGAATTIVDLRGRFNAAVKDLVKAIRGEPARRLVKAVPPPGPFGLPRRVSFSNGFLLVMLLANVVYLLTEILYFLQVEWIGEIIAYVLLLAMYTFYIADAALDILLRRHTFREIILATVISMFVVSGFNPIFAVLPALALVVFLTSAGTYRWLPTGNAPNWMRRQYGVAVAPTLTDISATLESIETPQSQRYTITYAHEDHWIAEQIEGVLRAGGHQRVGHDEDSPGTQHILILSGHTPIEMAEGLVRRDADTLTPVLAGNVAARETVEALGDFQFIDFREHSKEQLQAISLIYKHPEQGKVIYGFNVLPLSTSVLRWPQGVQRFNLLNHLTFILYIALTLALPMVRVDVVSAGTIVDFLPNFLWHNLPYAAFATAIGVVLHVRLAHLVQNRLLTHSAYQTWMWCLGGLSLLTGTFGLPVLITYFASRAAMQHWLPAEIVNHDSGPTLPAADANAARRRALRDGGLALLLVGLIVTDSALLALNDPDFMNALDQDFPLEFEGFEYDPDVDLYFDADGNLYLEDGGELYDYFDAEG
jgi:hypothetical protein